MVDGATTTITELFTRLPATMSTGLLVPEPYTSRFSANRVTVNTS